MDCANAAAKLSAYLDRELSPDVAKEVEEHLRACAVCRKELAAFAGADHLLRQSPAIAVSADFRARFWRKAREEEHRPAGVWERFILRWIPVPVLGALSIVLFLGFSTAAPMLYGLAGQQTKQDMAALAGSTLVVSSAKHVFAPAGFARFCSSCEKMLGKCCKECRNGSACRMHEEEKTQ